MSSHRVLQVGVSSLSVSLFRKLHEVVKWMSLVTGVGAHAAVSIHRVVCPFKVVPSEIFSAAFTSATMSSSRHSSVM